MEPPDVIVSDVIVSDVVVSDVIVSDVIVSDVIVSDPDSVSDVVVADAGPQYIVSMDELVSLRSAVLAKEAADASALRSVFQPDAGALRARLVDWAAAGFPHTFTLFSAQIFPPSACSDSVQRDLMPYIAFLVGSAAEDLVKTLEQQVLGIQLSFNVVQLNVVCLTVVRQ
jgi:hypothetical protein